MATATKSKNQKIISQGLMTLDEVADFLSLTRQSVYNMIERGDLPSLKLGAARRIPRSALFALVERKMRQQN
jgi:excisionase family DNA binding protein